MAAGLSGNYNRRRGERVKESAVTQPGKAFLILDMKAGFNELCWGSRNNSDSDLNAIRISRHRRKMGRQVVIIRHDSPDPDEKTNLRDRYFAVVSKSTAGKEKARPARLKPGLY